MTRPAPLRPQPGATCTAASPVSAADAGIADTPGTPPTRREALKRVARGGYAVLMLGAADLAWGASIVAVRVWPAAVYTRVTIESDGELKASHMLLTEGAPRLVVDIENLELNATLRELLGKVRPDDPFIAGVRVGQFQARLDQARRDLLRQQDLVGRKLVSKQAVETAQTEVDTLSAQLTAQQRSVDLASAQARSAQVQLDYTTVRAPFAGSRTRYVATSDVLTSIDFEREPRGITRPNYAPRLPFVDGMSVASAGAIATGILSARARPMKLLSPP